MLTLTFFLEIYMKQVITAVVASMFAVTAFASAPAPAAAPAAGTTAPAKCDPAKDKNCKAEAPKK